MVYMMHIHCMNFKTFDLNLLRVLDAMLAENNVTRAGERVGLSQPAVSSAINRMRHLLDDPLFVRGGNTMMPTPFAQSLELPVREALDALEYALGGGKPFDPARAERTFRVFGSDYFSEMLIPKLVKRIGDTAPGIRLQLIDTSQRSVLSQLSDDTIDFALAPNFETPEWVARDTVFHSSFLSVAAKDNKRIQRHKIAPGQTIPLDLFCDIPQVVFSVSGGFAGLEDQALTKIGRQRRVIVSLADFYGVARTVAQSQMIAVLPSRFAMALSDQLGLTVHPLPFDMPLERLYLYWHRRHAANAQHIWMRELMAEHLEPLDEFAHPLD